MLKIGLSKLFDPSAQENISEMIQVPYALSLYEMDSLGAIENRFFAAVESVKKLRKNLKAESIIKEGVFKGR